VSSLGAGGSAAGANVGGSGGGGGTSSAVTASAGTKAGGSAGRQGTGGSKGGAGMTADAGSSAANAKGGEAGASGPAPRELYFSEYVEAGGDKALEIAAVTATSLTGCVLATYSNGSTDDKPLKLDGAVAAGAVYTLCSSKVAAKVRCDRSTNLSFNGNDAVSLVCDGVTLDVIGQIGFDPGDAWSSSADDDGGASGAGAGGAGAGGAGTGGAGTGGVRQTGVPASTADQTLRRRCGITHGDADGSDRFDPSLEWVALPVDTLDGLGDPTCG
jgi:hypothetical protein